MISVRLKSLNQDITRMHIIEQVFKRLPILMPSFKKYIVLCEVVYVYLIVV